jgi:hypothetical protein
MTNLITLTIPNDDHIALRAFGKALEEMALAHGAERVQLQTYCNVTMNDEQNDLLRQKLKNVLGEPRDGDTDVTRAMVEQCAPRMMQEARFDSEELQGKRKEQCVHKWVHHVPAVIGKAEFDECNNCGEVRELKEGEESREGVPTTDSTGTPWDERIHSASKALNADGTWRLRRKPKDTDEAEWADYINETLYEIKPATTSAGKDIDKLISEIDTAGTHGEGLGGIEPPVTPPGDDFHTDTDVVTEQTVAGIPPLPVPPPVVVAPPVTEWDFPRLMTFLTERHGKIDVRVRINDRVAGHQRNVRAVEVTGIGFTTASLVTNQNDFGSSRSATSNC